MCKECQGRCFVWFGWVFVFLFCSLSGDSHCYADRRLWTRRTRQRNTHTQRATMCEDFHQTDKGKKQEALSLSSVATHEWQLHGNRKFYAAAGFVGFVRLLETFIGSRGASIDQLVNVVGVSISLNVIPVFACGMLATK